MRPIRSGQVRRRHDGAGAHALRRRGGEAHDGGGSARAHARARARGNGEVPIAYFQMGSLGDPLKKTFAENIVTTALDFRILTCLRIL